MQVVLFLNKIDRLILELKMSVSEATAALASIVTEINAFAAGLYLEDLMANAGDVGTLDEAEAAAAARGDAHEQLEFNPAFGNVAFGSASDGWAVRCSTFAALYVQPLLPR